MALPDQATPLSEEEFNRLEDLLASHIFSGEAMALEIQAVLRCAGQAALVHLCNLG